MLAEQKKVEFEVVKKTSAVGPSEVKPTTGKGAMLLALTDLKTGLLQLGVAEDLFDQVLTYAASLDPSIALRVTPWVLELREAVGKVIRVYGSQTPNYWTNAKLLGLKLPQLTRLREGTKTALEVWANRPGVLRPAR